MVFVLNSPNGLMPRAKYLEITFLMNPSRPTNNMFSTTHPKVERKIMTVALTIVLTTVAMFFCQAQSVHIASSKRRREENAVVFEMEIVNPTDEPVIAMIRLTVGTSISDKGGPSGSIHQKFPVAIPANKTVVFEKRFECVDAKLIGPVHSAYVVQTYFNQL